MKKIAAFAFLFLFASLPCIAKPELFVRTGHATSISALAFSPDGKTIASGCFDGTVKLWDIATQKEVGSLQTGNVMSLAWREDHKLVVGVKECTIQEWNTKERTLTKTIEASAAVTSLALSPDCSKVASGNYRAPVIWNMSTGKEIVKLQIPPGRDAVLDVRGRVNRIVWTPDEKTIIAGTDDGLKIWNASSGKLLPSLTAETVPVYSVALNKDGNLLAEGDKQGNIRIWDLPARKPLRTMSGHKKPVHALAFTPDGKHLASGGDTVKLWDIATGKEVHSMPLTDGSTYTVAFDSSGKNLAGADRNAIKIWDVQSAKELVKLEAHAQPTWFVASNPCGYGFASNGGEHSIRIWGFSSKPLVRCVSTENIGTESIAYSSDGKMLAAQGGRRGRTPEAAEWAIEVFDAMHGKKLHEIAGESWHCPVSFAPKTSTIAASYWYGRKLKLFDVNTQKELRSVKGCQSYAWSPDGTMLALGRNEGEIETWNVESWTRLKYVVGYKGTMNWGRKTEPAIGVVGSIAWSPDGKSIATEYDGEIKLWDSSTLVKRMSIEGCPKRPGMSGSLNAEPHSSGAQLLYASHFYGLLFSPDSKLLLARDAQLANTVSLWDTSSGKLLNTLKGHDDQVTSATFMANGKLIITSSPDNSIRFWLTDSAKELARLFSFGSNDWVVVTPDGRFDASAGGMNMLYGRDNDEILESDKLKERFQVPGLFQQITQPLFLSPGGYGDGSKYGF